MSDHILIFQLINEVEYNMAECWYRRLNNYLFRRQIQSYIVIASLSVVYNNWIIDIAE